jgi:uncharacterized protein (TIGR04141 family)
MGGVAMVRRPSEASKVSLYRLNLPAGRPEIDAIQSKYLAADRGFTVETVSVEAQPGLLVYGTIVRDHPDWIDHVASLTRLEPEVKNVTTAGVLIVRLDEQHNRCYALSWGMGHLLFNQAVTDDGFGLRFALRRANHKDIQALTSHALDTLPKTARMSVFGGASLDSFGLEEIGEVVSRLVGKMSAKGLSSERPDKDTFITVKGADALSIPLAKTPAGLLADLRLIDTIVETESVAIGVEHLENTQPLRPGNPKIKQLNDNLATALAPRASPRIALCWPAEWDEEVGEPASFEIKGLGRQWNGTYDELELDDFLIPIGDEPEDKRVSKLKAVKIQGKAAGGSALTRDIAGDRWITFETTLDGERYVFHRGRWYNVGGAYLRRLQDRIERILANKTSEALPLWPKMHKLHKRSGEPHIGPATEAIYNDNVVAALDGYYSLDRKLLQTEQHPRGFEACDILTPENALVHVKRLDDSVSASHLFNQAIVSSEALRRQVDALEKFRHRVHQISSGQRELPPDFRVKRVVLAFAGAAATTDNLFTFSQVTLSRCAQRLSELEIALEIAEIPDSDDILPS